MTDFIKVPYAELFQRATRIRQEAEFVGRHEAHAAAVLLDPVTHGARELAVRVRRAEATLRDVRRHVTYIGSWRGAASIRA